MECQLEARRVQNAKMYSRRNFWAGILYCIPGNFSDVETLANLVINSFSLKLQVANLALHCNTSTSTVCTLKKPKLAIIKRRNRLIFGKR